MAVAAFTRLTQGVDQNGNPIIQGVPQSNCINAMKFSGAVSDTQSLPQDASNNYPNFVLISVAQNVDCYMKFGASATTPAADVIDGSAPEMNPAPGGIWLRQIPKGTTQITINSAAACIVTLSYFG